MISMWVAEISLVSLTQRSLSCLITNYAVVDTDFCMIMMSLCQLFFLEFKDIKLTVGMFKKYM